VLAAEAPSRRLNDIEARLSAAIAANLAAQNRPYTMSFSMAALRIEPAEAASADITEVVARASGRMHAAAK